MTAFPFFILISGWLLMALLTLPLFAQSISVPSSPSELRAALLHPIAPINNLPPPNQTDDHWLSFDKVQHATFSFLWTLGSQYTLVNKIQLSEGEALPVSIGSAVVVGVSKELYDEHVTPGNQLSYRDLAADAAGIALATVLILL